MSRTGNIALSLTLHLTASSSRILVAMYAYVDCVQYGNVTEAKADCNADC